MRSEEIARLVERNQAAATVEIAGESRPIAGGCMAYEGPGSFMNRACGLGLDGPVTGDDLDSMIAFFTARGAEPRIEVSGYADPSLLTGLAARQFVLRDIEHFYVRELAAGDVIAPPHVTPGLVITRLDPTDEAAARAFVEISEGGFMAEGEPIPAGSITASLKATKHPHFAGFVATVDGVTAGASGSGTRAPISALFGTTVLGPYRRRGVQQALMAARLTHAQASGCTLATVSSKPGIGTERNALRLGFRLVFARVLLVRPGPGLVPSGD